MKKILSILMMLLGGVLVASSQAPAIFNYQGVARNSVGNVLVNKNITLRLTVHDGSAAGPVVYQESRAVTTNPFGLFNVQVGSPGATSVTGTIAGVNWGVGNKYIQVEIDPNGGTTFINIGTAQMASVPYAWYTNLAGDLVLPFNKTQADAGTLFKITNSGTGAGSTALEGLTNSTAANVSAIIGTVTPTGPGGFSTGVRGVNNGTGGLGIGVWGSQNGSGWGVYGQTPSGIGVHGASTSGFGVYGQSSSGTAIYGFSNTGRSGFFENTNAANTSVTLSAASNGTGWAGQFTSTNATTRALRTVGGLQLTGINEGLNRILGSDAIGNATWQTAAGLGLVSGSGTLNWVPKWTPNGTTLGNSIIEDRGINIVGINVPAAYTYTNGQQGMEIHNAAALLQARIVLRDVSDGGDVQGFVDARTSPTATLSALQVGTLTNHPITFFSNGAHIGRWSSAGNLGIGTTAGVDPTARLQIDNATTAGSVLVNQTSTTNTVRAMQVLNANISGATYGNSTIYAQRGTGSLANTYLFTGPPTSITGVSANAGIGVQGTSETQIGIAALSTSGIGTYTVSTGTATALRAEVIAGLGSPTAYALQTIGRVQISGQGAALNRVLTSDATGNATWQPLGAVGGVSGSGTLNFVPKWTPNGTTLGNSQIFDDGSQVTVGTATGNGSTLNLGVAPTSTSASLSFFTNPEGFNIHENASGQLNFEANNTGVGFGSVMMTLDDDNLNVGIGTTTPTANSKLNVDFGNFPNTGNTIYSNSNPATNGNLTGVYGRGGWYGVEGINDNTQIRGVSVGVRGIGGGSGQVTGYGVMAIANGTASGNNYGLYATASGATGSNFAAWLNGPVAITDGTEGLNKVFTSDAVGNGSWQTAAAAGLVSGTGTLNQVAKWTPDGVTLGNSVMFDNGNTVSVGSTTPWNNSLSLFPTPGSTEPSIFMGSGQYGGIYLEQATGKMHFTANNANVNTGNTMMTLDDDLLAVGIGTVNPVAKIDIDNNAGTGNGALRISQDLEVGIPAAKVLSEGPITFDVSNAPLWGDNSIFAQRGNFTVGTIQSANGAAAIMGVSPAGNGVEAISGTGIGLYANSWDGWGVYSRSQNGVAVQASTSAGTALLTSGGVRLTGIGEANGYVLTSDGAGNATWQENTAQSVGISLRTFTANNTITSSTITPLTNWATVINEDGGANFNPGTGEYTITKTGVYQINGSLLWSPTASGGSGVMAGMQILKNGVFEYESFSPVTQNTFVTSNISISLRLTAGDIISATAYQNTGANMTLASPLFGQHMSIQFMHK